MRYHNSEFVFLLAFDKPKTNFNAVMYNRLDRELCVWLFGKRRLSINAKRFTRKAVAARLSELRRRYSLFPLYAIIDSTDCDYMNTVTAVRYRNGWDAEKQINSMYDNAEGPTYVEWCSKAEYKSFKNSWRDIAAERAGY